MPWRQVSVMVLFWISTLWVTALLLSGAILIPPEPTSRMLALVPRLWIVLPEIRAGVPVIRPLSIALKLMTPQPLQPAFPRVMLSKRLFVIEKFIVELPDTNNSRSLSPPGHTVAGSPSVHPGVVAANASLNFVFESVTLT